MTPSKPKDDKGKTIEKQAPKASMQEKTSSIKCFKCLGRGHITSQCPTTKTMILGFYFVRCKTIHQCSRYSLLKLCVGVGNLCEANPCGPVV